MLAGLFDKGRNLIFIREHSLNVQIAGACSEILFISIFSRELIGDQMAAVIQVFPVDEIVLCGLKASRLNHSDGAAWRCRQGFLSQACDSGLRTTELIEGGILFILFS